MRFALAGTLVMLSMLACFGGQSGDIEMEEVEAALESATVLGSDAAMIETHGGVSEVESGDGVQVLHISPVGLDHRARQASVVFDRPMVAMSDLDAMTQQVPLECDPPNKGTVRWAGTATAVWTPIGSSFDLAHAYRCTVPAGTTALDGVPLEKDVSWEWETQRPEVSRAHHGERIHAPESPILLRFTHPVDVAKVQPFIRLTNDGNAMVFEVVSEESDPTVLKVTAKLAKGSTYRIEVQAGWAGELGPLTANAAFGDSFTTYPPLTIQSSTVEGPPKTRGRLGLQFSTPVVGAEVSEHIEFDPEPPGLSLHTSTWASQRYSNWLYFAPQTEYTVRLKPGMKDQFGQVLEEGWSTTFKTGDHEPRLHAAQGVRIDPAHNPSVLPYRNLNCAGIRHDSTTRSLEWYARQWQTHAEDLVQAAFKGDMTRTVLANESPRNQWDLNALDMAKLHGSDHPIWLVESFCDELVLHDYIDANRNSVLIRSAYGVTAKQSPLGLVAWVTSMETGEPAAGVEVTVYPQEAEFSGTTGPDGLATFPMPDGWNDGSQWGGPRLLVTAEGDAGVGLTWSDWNDGIAPWSAGIWSEWDENAKVPVSMGFIDRGIYRPGDPVYARAMWRVQSDAGLEMPPEGATVGWVLKNPDWDDVETGKGVLDAHGGFHTDLQLPEEARLGNWRLQMTAAWEMESSTVSMAIPLRAYREPAFRVEVHGEGPRLPGEKIESFADARYLFGAPMKRGSVNWRARSSNSDFRPEAYESFWFGPERRWWWEEESDDQSAVRVSGSEKSKLDNGRSVWSLEIPKEVHHTQRVTITADVVDIDKQMIGAEWSVLVHPSASLVGIRSTQRIPEAGSETGVEVVAVDPSGEGTAAEVQVEVVKRSYDRVRQKAVDGRWEWITSKNEETVHSESVSASGEPTAVRWTPKDPGSYVIRATATDSEGRSSLAEDSIWVRGAGVASWGIDEDQTLRLVPSKEEYRVGETAEILVQSPVPGLNALVTVERETVLYSEVVTLEGTAETIEIPIDDAWRPNIFVSVIAVEGAPPQDSPDKGRPQVRAGWAELGVSADDQRLAVEITPNAELYRPRDQVEVEVAVSRDGKPVSDAGVTLYAVDEAVLMLTAYETPDAHGSMYDRHSLFLNTSDSRSSLHNRAPYLTKGAADGGGGGEPMDEGGDSVRKRFVTTVAWKPDLVTGPDGTVKTSFELPDNLTTFRIMAVADADTIAFGSGEKEVVVNRPLIARPALPRGLRVDDMALAGVVVHNNTSVEQTVRVEAEASGAAELAGASKQIVIGPHDSELVRFRLKGLEVGLATLDFRVDSGSERDAIQVPLEVEAHQVLEVVATAGTTTGRLVEQIETPAVSDPDAGGLTVDIGTSALSGAGSGLDYLLQYPHGCVEQTTSRGLGALMALRVRKNAGLPQSEERLKAVVQAALTQMPGYRHSSGGMSYWKLSSRVSVIGTAYAVEFMGRAQEAGFGVNDALLQENASYLRDALVRAEFEGMDRRLSDQTRAYIAVALARAGQGDAGLNSRLYAQRASLGLPYQASLVEAIARTTGPDSRTSELLRGIYGRLYIDASSAKVTEDDASGYARLWGSDDLATASVLEAIIWGDPQQVLAPKLALHLAASKTSGRWANTRATAGVLASLAAYAGQYESSGGPVQTSVTLVGDSLLDEALQVPESRRVEIPLGDVNAGELVLEAKDGRVYYEYRLAYAPKEVQPRSEGFTVTRAATITDGAGPNGEVMVGATVDVILQIVTSVTRHDVAIIDPIPAGWEILDQSLATTSSQEGDDGMGDTGLFDEYGYAEGEEELGGPRYGGSAAFDHHEVDDIEIRLYSSYLPAGVHTYRYAVRATTPGVFVHPPAAAEMMYEPEIFGRTNQETMVIGRSPSVAER